MRPPVGPEQHADIHPPEGIGRYRHPSGTERLRHVPSLPRISPTHVDAGAVGGGTGSEEDHIETLLAECPGGRAGEPRPLGAVQHLDSDPLARRRHRIGMSRDLFAPGRQQQRRQAAEGEDRRDDYRGVGATTSRFQNATVGSIRGQPDWIRWVSRSRATVWRTEAGSRGNRSASSARCSRAKARPGSR
jgi:hypothetical protein